MSKVEERHFLGKVIIKGVLRLETALHIGAQTETMEIGGIDNPVLKDPRTGKPYIPGSSLKGKLRSLWERAYYEANKDSLGDWKDFFNRRIGDHVKIHSCNSWKDARGCKVCRLFGSSGGAKEGNFPSRLIFRDLNLERNFEDKDIEELFDIKYEAAIDRVTAAANPRPMERVLPGTEFEVEIVYNIEDINEAKEDISNLFSAIKLLEDDYLGGSGSRGYGKVSFEFQEAIIKKLDYYIKGEKEKTLRDLSDKKLREVAQRITEQLNKLFSQES